jgi:hypothetical protein
VLPTATGRCGGSGGRWWGRGSCHTARQIADQLGQAKVSITQDIYMGRQAANPAAAAALERAFEDPELL